ncbi:hypothetical protein [Streptomyces sp. BPTC-684]|uniref:hypothetical protein n=1 Tax=Streptomyces sp. BPTC-684 TaxID=3043734 RepID=UPI0024B205F3|nr:hypothetical protein [Streptomyces sp. BPTC-684]WHM40254.1 hypothetical protein QIY60_27625 [Streptomyces sp. BPTC-684]
MTEDEKIPETPQGSAVGLAETSEGESAPEITASPERAIEGPSLDELRANLESVSAALRESEELRQQLDAQLKAAEVTLERERVARRYNLPDELAPFLRGESAEELEKEAATLAKYATAIHTNLGVGGLDPTDTFHSAGDVARRVNREARSW